MNIVQTETMMAGSVLRQRNLVMPMRHPSHPMKAWGRTRPTMMTMRIPKMISSSENSSDEENNPWTTLINEAVSKVWDQYKEILQELLMEGHGESKAKEDAFAQILPAFRKELGDVHMDNLTWMTVIWKFSKASVKLLE